MRHAVFSIAVISVLLCGCPEIGVMSKDTSSAERDSIELETPRKDIVDIIVEVGKSLNYAVSHIDKEIGIVCLQNESNPLIIGAIGYASAATLTISVEDGGKKVNITTSVAGNLGAGKKERAVMLTKDFKDKLLAYIKQK